MGKVGRVGNNGGGSTQTDAVEALRRGLRTELGLLEELSRGLVAQREAIAADDTAALGNLIQELSRTLLTLREARRQRKILVEIVTGQPDTPLGELLRCLPPESSPSVGNLCRELKDRAVAANRELTINQTVIRRAIQSGERFLHQLLTAPNLDLYRNQSETDVPGGMLLNQRA
jgi:FlgN protein